MAYNGFVVEIKKLRKHTNADRLQIATVFGNDVVVGLEVNLGDKMIYFPTDGQLSEEFCTYNHLCSKIPGTEESDTGYMDSIKRNIKAIRLRGEKSDGLLCPINCLDYIDHEPLNVGDKIDCINGKEICCKYIPKTNLRTCSGRMLSKQPKNKTLISPLFNEHVDTDQLNYNLAQFNIGDEIEITLKCHGTSQRTAYLPVFKRFKRNLFDVILRKEGVPIYDWKYITGTRRTVLSNYEGGFYGTDVFREQHAKVFEGKLRKGEEVYYEVVGYANESTPIMPKGNNAKVDKEFTKKYGKETTFSYGCKPGESKALVYRMTMTNEDGDVVEYTPDFMRYRCEQMEVECVPVFTKFIIPDKPQIVEYIEKDGRSLINYRDVTPGEYVQYYAEQYFDGPDPIGKTHIREGVVCRIINRPIFKAFKTKNFSFKVLEGIIKDNASQADIEESQEIIN